jgi:VWFA-related protein
MKNRFFWFALTLVLVVLTVSVAVGQETAAPRLEITGVNASGLPEVTITANVTDTLGQPVPGLGIADFTLSGALADVGRVVSVENLTDDNLHFSSVLVIDTSSSMAGTPIERAREAAIAYVNALRDEDAVALLTFNNDVYTLSDFTTDKAALIATINGLRFGGETALYDAGVAGVELAAASGNPRRAVVLLSDGGDFGTASTNPRGAALERARQLGVPIYTIGLGFGSDRSYLDQLATGTNGRYFEAPSGDELVEIYGNLATLFRSQYVITLEADVPPDGTEYGFGLGAVTAEGATNTASTTMRAPIPVPIVRLPQIESPLVSEPTVFTFDVLADDQPVSVTSSLNDGERLPLDAEPYTIGIDPFLLEPGPANLTVAATDSDGDTGSARLELEIAALPARLTLDSDLAALGELVEPLTVNIDAEVQSPVTAVRATIDGLDAGSSDTLPFAVTIDPFLFEPGEHLLRVEVDTANGVTASSESTFTAAALPPIISITNESSLPAVLSTETQLEVVVRGQTPATRIALLFNGELLEEAAGPVQATFTLDPLTLPPGPATVSISASDRSRMSTILELPVTIAALDPEVEVSGITEGEVLTGPRTIEVTVGGQTPAQSVQFRAGNQSATETAAPYTFTMQPEDFDAQPTRLTITVTNTGGRSVTREFMFAFDEQLFITPTATPTDTPTVTPTATPTPTATLDIPASQTFEAQLIIATADAQATLDTVATFEIASTAAAQETQAAEFAQATSDAAATADAEATTAFQIAQATTDAQATLDAQVEIEAQATTDAQATADTQDALDAQATTDAQDALDAQATLDVQATTDAQATAETQDALDAQATADAQTALDAQATADAQATTDAQSAEELAATEAAQATEDALSLEATVNAIATQDALATSLAEIQRATDDTVATQTALDAATLEAQRATQQAIMTVTQVARSIVQQTQQATLDAGATEAALQTQTAEAQLTLEAEETQAAFDAQSTADAQATTDAQATADAAAAEIASGTRIAEQTATSAAVEVAALNAQETADALLTATAEDSERATREAELAEIRQQTAAAIDTATAVAATDEPTQTPEASETPDADSTAVFDPTVTPPGVTDIVEAQGASQPLDWTVALAAGCGLLIVVFLILVFAMRRRRR